MSVKRDDRGRSPIPSNSANRRHSRESRQPSTPKRDEVFLTCGLIFLSIYYVIQN